MQVGTDISAHEVVGRLIHVHWPAEDAYFLATVASYDPVTAQHLVQSPHPYCPASDHQHQQVEYHDGDFEHLNLQNERVRVLLGTRERLASDPAWRPGDVVWAASTKDCPPWPALVVSALDVADVVPGSVRRHDVAPVQFFGSHEYAWVRTLQHLQDGLQQGLHVCRSLRHAALFDDALYELHCYLKVRQLAVAVCCALLTKATLKCNPEMQPCRTAACMRRSTLALPTSSPRATTSQAVTHPQQQRCPLAMCYVQQKSARA